MGMVWGCLVFCTVETWHEFFPVLCHRVFTILHHRCMILVFPGFYIIVLYHRDTDFGLDFFIICVLCRVFAVLCHRLEAWYEFFLFRAIGRVFTVLHHGHMVWIFLVCTTELFTVCLEIQFWSSLFCITWMHVCYVAFAYISGSQPFQTRGPLGKIFLGRRPPPKKIMFIKQNFLMTFFSHFTILFSQISSHLHQFLYFMLRSVCFLLNEIEHSSKIH